MVYQPCYPNHALSTEPRLPIVQSKLLPKPGWSQETSVIDSKKKKLCKDEHIEPYLCEAKPGIPRSTTLWEWYTSCCYFIGMILSLGLTNPPYLQVLIILPTNTDSLLPYLLPRNITPLLLLSLASRLVIIPTQYFKLKLLPNHTSHWLNHHISLLTCAKRNLVYPYLANTGW